MKHITVLTYCLIQERVYQSRVHNVEELLAIWHGIQRSAVDSAIDGVCLRACVRAKEDILSSDNMLIEWAVIEAVKLCSKFVEYVFQIS